MSTKSMRAALGIMTLFALSGCESDAKKLERLEMDRLIVCINARAAEEDDRYADSIVRARRTECTLAERELNRFMQ